jgi:hypothetical protein
MLLEANVRQEPDEPMPLRQVVLWLTGIAVLALVFYVLVKLGILHPDVLWPDNL